MTDMPRMPACPGAAVQLRAPAAESIDKCCVNFIFTKKRAAISGGPEEEGIINETSVIHLSLRPDYWKVPVGDWQWKKSCQAPHPDVG